MCVLYCGSFQYKIKTIKSQVYICLIHCYDTQHIWEPIFIFHRHSVILDSLL